MFVQIVINPESGSQDIFVLGEKLVRDEKGVYMIPGRLITGLKTDDLPVGYPFGLLDHLPSGVGFYREDAVTIRRENPELRIDVQVTTRYVRTEWDGIYSLVSTMDMRRRLLEDTQDYHLKEYTINEQVCELAFSFQYDSSEEQDLENAMEEICERVRWVEEKGTQQLLFRSFYPQFTITPDE